MEEILDVADPEAMSRRGSKEGWPNIGKINSGFTSPGSSEVHGIVTVHKVLAYGGRCQIRQIHDMEGPQPQQEPLHYVAIYIHGFEEPWASKFLMRCVPEKVIADNKPRGPEETGTLLMLNLKVKAACLKCLLPRVYMTWSSCCSVLLLKDVWEQIATMQKQIWLCDGAEQMPTL